MNATRLQELRTMEYGDYLKTPEWLNTRTEALRRAKYRCQICNSGVSLNVHHRTYENRGDEDLSDLTVLCGDCHRIFHVAGKIAYVEADVIPQVIRTWYTDEDGKLIKW